MRLHLLRVSYFCTSFSLPPSQVFEVVLGSITVGMGVVILVYLRTHCVNYGGPSPAGGSSSVAVAAVTVDRATTAPSVAVDNLPPGHCSSNGESILCGLWVCVLNIRK